MKWKNSRKGKARVQFSLKGTYSDQQYLVLLANVHTPRVQHLNHLSRSWETSKLGFSPTKSVPWTKVNDACRMNVQPHPIDEKFPSETRLQQLSTIECNWVTWKTCQNDKCGSLSLSNHQLPSMWLGLMLQLCLTLWSTLRSVGKSCIMNILHWTMLVFNLAISSYQWHESNSCTHKLRLPLSWPPEC